jgi:hypothetical protein
LADVFEECQEIFNSDKSRFLSLLENHIDLDSIIPVSFRNYYYASTGRSRKYPLKTFLGDATFDFVGIYKQLLGKYAFHVLNFTKVYIPLNRRSAIKSKYTINENDIPC